MAKRLFSIRGATGAENTADSIRDNVTQMCLRLFSENHLLQSVILRIITTKRCFSPPAREFSHEKP